MQWASSQSDFGELQWVFKLDSHNEGVENNGEAGGQDHTSNFSAAQFSGFTTLPKGML